MKIPGSSWFYWGILIFMEERVNMTQISSENSKGNNIHLVISTWHKRTYWFLAPKYWMSYQHHKFILFQTKHCISDIKSVPLVFIGFSRTDIFLVLHRHSSFLSWPHWQSYLLNPLNPAFPLKYFKCALVSVLIPS